jgi:hypothetical protein
MAVPARVSLAEITDPFALEVHRPVELEGAPRPCRRCWHLIGERLDITDSRWGVKGAESVPSLRAVINNGDFEAY